MRNPAAKRGSGILLHVTSLPSLYGIGDLGPAAYEFADFLVETKQRYWQILPLGPTDPVTGNSPYSSTSAFAGNSLLISPDLMMQDGLLTKDDLRPLPPSRRVAYPEVMAHRERLLRAGFRRFKQDSHRSDFERFRADEAAWLEDYATFAAIKVHLGRRAWGDWPHDVRQRRKAALQDLKRTLAEEIELAEFTQFVFFKQWRAFKQYCNDKGINLIGDIPIYVSDDSADAWSHSEIFKMDEDCRPTVVAGVPPDYFSKTGQLWGNPIYRWDVLKAGGYKWWIARIRHALALYDVVRIDHFRGFLAYWEVPAGEKTAVNGCWADAPAEDFFEILSGVFPHLPIVAEDLGVITPDVKALMKRFGLPGMRVLLFAFGDGSPRNPYLPHNYVEDCVAYTGTHDNNTARGWFEGEARPQEKRNLARYLGCEVTPENVASELVRLAMMSVAATTIFPVQDILGLGEDARMNLPSTPEGNWGWRLLPGEVNAEVGARLAEITETYGRTPAEPGTVKE
ncbi:MAG TPA: 4-alpha-glucanotransferase [bacterium]|nr:4-alpha-glucanotransferase [bacterium]